MFSRLFKGFSLYAASALVALPALSSAAATPPAASTGTGQESLNKRQVQDLYFSGEFDPLIALLENMRRERHLRDRQDSIFIFKYLGVVYGADTTTRRKAESFLYAMLRLDPGQNLNDMEVGDNIELLFHQVKQRFDQSYKDSALVRERARPVESPSALPKTTAPPETALASESNRKTWIWVAGGAAAAAVATGAVLMLQSPEPETRTITTVVR